MEQFESEMLIRFKAFYKDETMFGIWSCDTVEYIKGLKFNRYGKVSIQGKVPELTVGKKYKMKIEGPHFHAIHGAFYKILELRFEKMDTIESQDSFLRGIIAEKNFISLKKAYPEEKLVDLIMDNKVDVRLTKGIKEATLKNIKASVNDNMKLFNLMAQLQALKISSNKLSKILEHFSTAENAIATINKNIYELCKISGFGFKTVDEIALRRGDDPNNRQRIEACILYYLRKDASDGHTWSIKSHILAKCVELLNLQVSTIETTMINMNSSRIHQNEMEIGFTRIKNAEMSIYRNLKRINENYVAPTSDDINFRLKQTEIDQGFPFTDEQRIAIIEGFSHGVMILNGLAGAGKSATVKGLIDSLGTENYMTAALSGKAVNVLSQRGINASTIHRMLQIEGDGFHHNEDNPLPYEVVVLDETSMINVNLILSVLVAIPNGSKLIIVGDSGQLPAIGYGDVLRDLLSTNMFAKFELTKVHRQAEKSGILSLANRIRKGEQVLSYNWSGHESFGESEDQSIIGRHNKKEVFELVLKTARHHKTKITTVKDLLDFQVIVANKERGDLSVKNLNEQLQAIFNDLDKPFLNRNGYKFREGDKIITQGNIYRKLKFSSIKEYYEIMRMFDSDISKKLNKEKILEKYEFDLYNGTLGYIESLSLETEEKLIFIRLEGQNGVVVLVEDEMKKIDMAYAATVHKLQGSSIKNVIFALDISAYVLLSKQLVYTGITRASEKGLAIVETNAFHTAIKNDASGVRRTYLADIIFSQTQHK